MKIIQNWEEIGKQGTEYIQFDRIENKRSNRPDLHAMLLIDELVPGTSDLISASTRDEFYFSVEPEELDAVITEEQVLELIRCGVMYSPTEEALYMFT